MHATEPKTPSQSLPPTGSPMTPQDNVATPDSQPFPTSLSGSAIADTQESTSAQDEATQPDGSQATPPLAQPDMTPQDSGEVRPGLMGTPSDSYSLDDTTQPWEPPAVSPSMEQTVPPDSMVAVAASFDSLDGEAMSPPMPKSTVWQGPTTLTRNPHIMDPPVAERREDDEIPHGKRAKAAPPRKGDGKGIRYPDADSSTTNSDSTSTPSTTASGRSWVKRTSKAMDGADSWSGLTRRPEVCPQSARSCSTSVYLCPPCGCAGCHSFQQQQYPYRPLSDPSFNPRLLPRPPGGRGSACSR